MAHNQSMWSEAAPGTPGSVRGVRLPPFRWGPWATVGWVAVIGAVTMAGVAVIAVALTGILIATGAEQHGLGTTFLRLVQQHLAGLTALQALIVALMVVALTRRKGSLDRVQMLALGPIRPGRLVGTVAAIVVAIVVLTELPQWILGISDREAIRWLTQLRPQWLAILVVVAIGPISEELLFRGFLYGGLAPSRIGPVGAIAVSSLMWAGMHFQYAWPILIQVTVYGIVLGVARWRTGSLWPPMAAHVLINLYAAVAAYSTFGPPP